ncbi:Plasmodium exported protein (Pm-fam-a like), unknown function [Plasmodium malariae]|uniref:Uncharacterized protein n=1 Tax=Plasmodium malariae TaxID=5858 RepID=A0A1A8WRP4_PLAMA|nr:Plasmodium exported protein (Pm-fam-a like), unknown function [Plasmodium malariae]
MLKKYVLEHDIDKKLDTRNYRLLENYKQENYLKNILLNYSIPNIGEYKEKDTFNDKITEGKNKKRNECSLNNIKDYEQARKDKSSIYTGGNSYVEKRILDNMFFLNNIRGDMNDNKRKLIKKRTDKYLLILWLPVLLVVVGFTITFFLCIKKYFGSLPEWSDEITAIIVLFLTLSIFVFIVITFACKKIKKYDNSLRKISKMIERDYLYFPNV